MIGGNTEGFTCSLCYQICEETEGRMGKTGMICDNCDEEPDLENETKQNIKESTGNCSPFNTFSNETKKDKEKVKELSEKELLELNNQIIIPTELNIIDCPVDINLNPNWFRIQFRNFWRLFNSVSEWVFIIHDRGTGKSKQTAIHELYQIVTNKDYEGCFIMRNRDEPTRQTKEYFNKIIREFDESIWQGQRISKGKFHLQWNAIWKGVQYKTDLSEKKGELKCHFLDLYSPEQARTLINKPIRTIFFDECVPTRNQIKEGKGWKPDEGGKYMEAVKSLGRGTKPKKIFTGNPNDSWRNCWMLTLHFSEELTKLEKWYWSIRPKSFTDWLAWSWTKELIKGNKIFQLKKIVREPEDFPTYEDDNWDNFFQKPEDLKIVEHKNSATPMWTFNDCVLYHHQSKNKSYFYFISHNNQEISQRDKELLKQKPEYCLTSEQRMRSKQRIKRDRESWDFQKKLLRWYEKGLLFFADMTAKSLIEEFLAKKRTQSEF